MRRHGLAIGVRVRFRFPLYRVTLAEPHVEKSGIGVVIADDIYSVWPCPGYAIRVTDSPDYPSGTVVSVTRHHLYPESEGTS
jgi:hypothetical protein